MKQSHGEKVKDNALTQRHPQQVRCLQRFFSHRETSLVHLGVSEQLLEVITEFQIEN